MHFLACMMTILGNTRRKKEDTHVVNGSAHGKNVVLAPTFEIIVAMSQRIYAQLFLDFGLVNLV